MHQYLNYKGPRRRTGKAIATHSRIFAWKIPWAEEPGRLQSMVLQRVGHDWSDLAAVAVAAEEEEKNKGYEKNFEEIIVENFPNMEKERVNQLQEAQRG